MPAVITIELKEETLSALDAFAAKLDQSRDALVGQALEEWLSLQDWRLEEIEAGIADADAGRFVSDEEIARIVAGHDVS